MKNKIIIGTIIVCFLVLFSSLIIAGDETPPVEGDIGDGGTGDSSDEFANELEEMTPEELASGLTDGSIDPAEAAEVWGDLSPERREEFYSDPAILSNPEISQEFANERIPGLTLENGAAFSNYNSETGSVTTAGDKPTTLTPLALGESATVLNTGEVVFDNVEGAFNGNVEQDEDGTVNVNNGGMEDENGNTINVDGDNNNININPPDENGESSVDIDGEGQITTDEGEYTGQNLDDVYVDDDGEIHFTPNQEDSAICNPDMDCTYLESEDELVLDPGHGNMPDEITHDGTGDVTVHETNKDTLFTENGNCDSNEQCGSIGFEDNYCKLPDAAPDCTPRTTARLNGGSSFFSTDNSAGGTCHRKEWIDASCIVSDADSSGIFGDQMGGMYIGATGNADIEGILPPDYEFGKVDHITDDSEVSLARSGIAGNEQEPFANYDKDGASFENGGPPSDLTLENSNGPNNFDICSPAFGSGGASQCQRCDNNGCRSDASATTCPR